MQTEGEIVLNINFPQNIRWCKKDRIRSININKSQSNLTKAASNSPHTLYVQDFLALAVCEIRRGWQKLKVGDVNPPRPPYDLLLHSFRKGQQPSICKQNWKTPASAVEICTQCSTGPKSVCPKQHLDPFSHICTMKPSRAAWQTGRHRDHR